MNYLSKLFIVAMAFLNDPKQNESYYKHSARSRKRIAKRYASKTLSKQIKHFGTFSPCKPINH